MFNIQYSIQNDGNFKEKIAIMWIKAINMDEIVTRQASTMFYK